MLVRRSDIGIAPIPWQFERTNDTVGLESTRSARSCSQNMTGLQGLVVIRWHDLVGSIRHATQRPIHLLQLVLCHHLHGYG